MIELASIEFVGAPVVVRPRSGAGIRGRRVVQSRTSLRVDARLSACARVGRVDRRRAGGEVKVTAGRVLEPGTGLEAVRFLSARRFERRERGVVEGVPDQHHVRRAQIDQVVVHRRACG